MTFRLLSLLFPASSLSLSISSVVVFLDPLSISLFDLFAFLWKILATMDHPYTYDTRGIYYIFL